MGMPWADVHKIARLGRITGPFPVSRLPLPSDRKSTRLNSSHSQISYAVFCLKKKNILYAYNPHQSLTNYKGYAIIRSAQTVPLDLTVPDVTLSLYGVYVHGVHTALRGRRCHD